MTLSELARQLGVTDHAVYLLAGNLVGRYGYGRVIADPSTGEITDAAVKAIRAYAAGRTNTVMLAG